MKILINTPSWDELQIELAGTIDRIVCAIKHAEEQYQLIEPKYRPNNNPVLQDGHHFKTTRGNIMYKLVNDFVVDEFRNELQEDFRVLRDGALFLIVKDRFWFQFNSSNEAGTPHNTKPLSDRHIYQMEFDGFSDFFDNTSSGDQPVHLRVSWTWKDPSSNEDVSAVSNVLLSLWVGEIKFWTVEIHNITDCTDFDGFHVEMSLPGDVENEFVSPLIPDAEGMVDDETKTG